MTYRWLSPAQCAAALLLVALGAALMLLAQRRQWRPSLALAVYTAALLRLVMLAVTYRLRPFDVAYDFQVAGYNVLHHQDPILNARPSGWDYLPAYAFLLAGAYWADLHLHLSWAIIVRIMAIAFDLGVVVLVGVVAGAAGDRAALRRFQYACNPLAILVSSLHGQMEPACLLLSLAAFAIVLRGGPLVSGRMAAAAGILLGLGIAIKTWPVLFGPALLLALPSWRRRWQFAAGAAGVPALLFVSLPVTVGTPAAKLPYIARVITGYHPVTGNWTWAGLWLALHVHKSNLPIWQDPLWLNVGSIGTKAAMAGALLAVWWWRRAHPLDVATATTTALVAITPSFGSQYLLWQAPSATARPTRLSIPLQVVLGGYAAMAYLPMDMLTWRYWKMANAMMMLLSFGVVALMIAALPWRRRQWQPRQARQHRAVMQPSDAAAA
ncbi:MAG: DUF2029 domain-containing protein [Streptosporangiaceae bacterium]|nr:DUF2029 domain-containing protein [Streptosporangiaceae bacterium]